MSAAHASAFIGRLLGCDVGLVLLSDSNHTVYADKAIGLVLKCHTGAFGYRFGTTAEAWRHFHAVENVLEALGARGAPIVESFKLDSRSTFLFQGSILTTHKWVQDEGTDARQIADMAASLYRLHRGLRRLEAAARFLPLPATTVARYREARSRFCARWTRLLDPIVGRNFVADVAAHDAPVQLLHGDADIRNCFTARHSCRWGDWEDLQSGPVEWDIASTIASIIRELGRAPAECFLQNYPGPFVPKLLFDCVDFCIAQDAVWRMGPAAPMADELAFLQRCLDDAASLRRRCDGGWRPDCGTHRA